MYGVGCVDIHGWIDRYICNEPTYLACNIEIYKYVNTYAYIFIHAHIHPSTHPSNSSYTHDETEFSMAVCLCGMMTCRGSFLHFAGYGMFQKIIERNYGVSRRFADLMLAGVGKSLQEMRVGDTYIHPCNSND